MLNFMLSVGFPGRDALREQAAGRAGHWAMRVRLRDD
jgi:hypothetical protein